MRYYYTNKLPFLSQQNFYKFDLNEVRKLTKLQNFRDGDHPSCMLHAGNDNVCDNAGDIQIRCRS